MAVETAKRSILQPFLNFPLTQGFGATDFAAEPPGYGFAHFHDGEDYGAPIGTPVTPFKNGVIQKIGNDPGGYGTYATVKLDGTNETVLFGHLKEVKSPVQKLQEGSHVQAYEVIGLTGSTGNSTGPHIHFRVQDAAGTLLKPSDWLKQFGPNIAPANGDVGKTIGNAASADVTTVTAGPVAAVSGAVSGAVASGVASGTSAVASTVSGLIPKWLAQPDWFKVGLAVVALLLIWAGLVGIVFGNKTVQTATKAGVKASVTG